MRPVNKTTGFSNYISRILKSKVRQRLPSIDELSVAHDH
jgi:hypothetical protein